MNIQWMRGVSFDCIRAGNLLDRGKTSIGGYCCMSGVLKCNWQGCSFSFVLDEKIVSVL